jgi:hypothetical protein
MHSGKSRPFLDPTLAFAIHFKSLFRGCAVKSIANILTLVCFGSLLFTSPVFAAIEDSRFDMSLDGARVDFDVREVSRHGVLDRLFANKGIELEWRNSANADETITGTFNGTFASVARQLLAPMNFVIVYGGRGNAARISRIVVLGPVGLRASPGLVAIDNLKSPLVGGGTSSGTTMPAPRPNAMPGMVMAPIPLAAAARRVSALPEVKPSSMPPPALAPISEFSLAPTIKPLPAGFPIPRPARTATAGP